MKNKLFKIILLIVISVILLFGYKFLYVNYGITIDCPIHKITKLYCPGCGITRMIFALINLDFYQAFRYNPLLFITIPLWLFLIIDYLVSYLKDQPTYTQKHLTNKFWFSLIILFIIFGALRNTSTFDYLAPTEITKISQK